MAPDGAQGRRSDDRGGWRQERERPGQRPAPGARAGLPDSRSAGQPGSAVPAGVGNAGAGLRTPLGAAPTRSRASERCGAPRRLQEAQGEGRSTEALLGLEHHLPRPEGESHASALRERSFGSRNPPRTYFEKPQSHKHCSRVRAKPRTRAGQTPLSPQTPAGGTETAPCAPRRRLRAVSSAPCLRGDGATAAWENGFFMNGREGSCSAHARRSRFYEWVGTRDPRARMRRVPYSYYFFL